MNEISVRTSLYIKNGSLNYQNKPTSFQANMAGTAGPTPGAITVTSGGTKIDLSQLDTLGGMCRVMNLDATYNIEVGVYEISSGKFFPLMLLLPGETYVFRLSDRLSREFIDTGTGSVGNTTYFWAKVAGPHGTPSCKLLVEAFDA